MLERADFEAYDQGFGPRTREERESAHAIDQYFLRPYDLLFRNQYVQAVKTANSAVNLAQVWNLSMLAAERASSCFDFVLESVDKEWRLRAFAGCVVRECTPLTLVNCDDGDEVILFRGWACPPRSQDHVDAISRAELLEAGGRRSVAVARKHLLEGCAHVGQDDLSLTGDAAHELVTLAVQHRLLDWNDAMWWWPARFSDRRPAEVDGPPGNDDFLEFSYPALPEEPRHG